MASRRDIYRGGQGVNQRMGEQHYVSQTSSWTQNSQKYTLDSRILFLSVKTNYCYTDCLLIGGCDMTKLDQCVPEMHAQRPAKA